MKTNKKSTTAEFIRQAEIVHNSFYTYKNTKYETNRTKVQITCPVHGDFSQRPYDHKAGRGCPRCKSAKQSNRQLSTTKEFVEKAKNIHSSYYTYTHTCYSTARTKITITCPVHGNFTMSPADHLQGRGCTTCGRTKTCNVWSYSGWKKAGEQSKQFQGYCVYIIEAWNDSESFIKIGKTYTDIHKRLRNLPYEYKVLEQFYGSADTISNLETFLHKVFKDIQTIPSNSFGGKYECFLIKEKPNILTTAKEAFINGTTDKSQLQVDESPIHGDTVVT